MKRLTPCFLQRKQEQTKEVQVNVEPPAAAPKKAWLLTTRALSLSLSLSVKAQLCFTKSHQNSNLSKTKPDLKEHVCTTIRHLKEEPLETDAGAQAEVFHSPNPNPNSNAVCRILTLTALTVRPLELGTA